MIIIKSSKPCLIILLSIDKNLEKKFYYTILTFGLFIKLRIENYQEFLVNIKKLIE